MNTNDPEEKDDMPDEPEAIGSEPSGPGAADSGAAAPGPSGPEATAPEPSGQDSTGQEPTGQGSPDTGAGPSRAGTAAKPPGRLRRLVRGRGGVAVVGALVGALLGTGFMAWRSDELPFVDRDMCWGSLSPDVAHALFSDTDVRGDELPLRRATEDRMHTECSMRGYGDGKLETEVTASVRTLGDLHGAQAWEWTEQYLSSRMTPLGGGATGMASSTRAWVALPASCEERSYEPGEKPPLRVVTLASDAADPDGENEVDARRGLDAMSRAVVRLADGVMERYGCEGGYDDPPRPARAPEGNELRDVDADRLCGIEGVRLPGWARGSETKAVRTTPGAGADASSAARVRSCEVRQPFGATRLQLTTVAEPELAGFVSQVLGNRAARLGGDGQGATAGGLSVYTAKCQTGRVAFMAHEPGHEAVKESGYEPEKPGAAPGTKSLGLAVLPSYVKAEAKRVGCGDVTVRVPGALQG